MSIVTDWRYNAQQNAFCKIIFTKGRQHMSGNIKSEDIHQEMRCQRNSCRYAIPAKTPSLCNKSNIRVRPMDQPLDQ